VETVYHLAGLTNAKAPRNILYLINCDGTRNVWNCAKSQGVKNALYCSSTAVYGLLAKKHEPISEEVIPRAIEAYGRSKLEGEFAALEIAASSNMKTVVIRPVAIFGPNQHTPFGKQLQHAVFSKLLLPGDLEKRAFNFVHVEDVAEASIHLMTGQIESGSIYNIAGESAIKFEEAFQTYLLLLRGSENPNKWPLVLARLSSLAQRFPKFTDWLTRQRTNRLVFNLWQPGFDMTYSSNKLLSTSFHFKWVSFEKVLRSCLIDKKSNTHDIPGSNMRKIS